MIRQLKLEAYTDWESGPANRDGKMPCRHEIIDSIRGQNTNTGRCGKLTPFSGPSTTLDGYWRRGAGRDRGRGSSRHAGLGRGGPVDGVWDLCFLDSGSIP